MPTKEPPKTVRRRTAVVEYEDGKVEEFNLGKPIYEYEITQAGVDVVNGSDSVFWTLWLAAGKPGANGDPIDVKRDRPVMESWIRTLAAYEFPDPVDVPPTTQRAASRT